MGAGEANFPKNGKMKAFIFVVCCVAFALAQPSAPIWPNNFSIEFVEKTSVIHSGSTNGTLYYDAANNRERLDRATGTYDRYCHSVNSDDTPCTIAKIKLTSYRHSLNRGWIPIFVVPPRKFVLHVLHFVQWVWNYQT